MNSLAARRADQRVVVQRRDDAGPSRVRQRGQIERKIQEVMDVNDVRPDGVQHVLDLAVHPRRSIRLVEPAELPVVDDLDDGDVFVAPPPNLPVVGGEVVLGRQHPDVMFARQRARELVRVDLRPREMPRQKIMDRVQHAQPVHITVRRRARAASCAPHSRQRRA